MKFNLVFIAVLAAGVLSACGGGGSSSLNPSSDSPGSSWQPGVFADSEDFQARCALPRSGVDVFGNAFADQQGTAFDEKMWLRSWSDELYLWYDEIIDRNPDDYSIATYFDQLKTTETTPTGRPKDNFHFSQDTAEYTQLSQSGVRSGYGMQLMVDNDASPRTITVVFTEPNSPASNASIRRGAQILSIDGVSVDTDTQSGIDTLNAGLFPADAGEGHTFVIQNLGDSPMQTVELVSEDVVTTPVQNVSTYDVGGQTVGYFLFNSHIATAEAGLVDAVDTLAAADIDELVLDLRYNGGGFLTIASQLAYMIAGENATNGRGFETLQFNDKYPNTNPVTNEPIQPIGFANTTVGFSLSEGQALPTLNLNRVFVLTSASTCSASEAIINGLRGIDIEVIQIGKSTCGKPYGFYATDNCGTTYFSIQFQGVNDKGFGEYPDGFSPADSLDGFGVELPGCDVDDDLSRQLGDQSEARLAAALDYIANGSCSSGFTRSKLGSNNEKASVTSTEPELLGIYEWEKSRILDGPR